jgi:hypothetical protein
MLEFLHLFLGSARRANRLTEIPSRLFHVRYNAFELGLGGSFQEPGGDRRNRDEDRGQSEPDGPVRLQGFKIHWNLPQKSPGTTSPPRPGPGSQCRMDQPALSPWAATSAMLPQTEMASRQC